MATRQDKMTIERIERAIIAFSPMVALEPKISSDDVRDIIRVFMRKHPEIFWFSHQYSYDDKTGILRLKYNFTKEKADFFKGEIEKVVKKDFNLSYVRNISLIERLVYVYKWIAYQTTYNEYSSFNQTIYSVLINRNSVCTGYAKTAQYLLGLVGIESELVFGKFHSDKSEHGRHCWNIVKIGGAWFHVDFCLAHVSMSYLLNKDESPFETNSFLWNYFGVTTDKILSNRSIDFIETLPECNEALTGYPNVALLNPRERLICCKSDSGSSSKIYLDPLSKHLVIKVSREGQTKLLDNEAAILSKLSGCQHVITSYGLNEYGLRLEQLTPWSELLNSHYYNPSETDLINILLQLIKGLYECRQRGISYSDIHYNNVFVAKDGTYKWGDFGLAYSIQQDGKLPPELIDEDGKAKGSYWFMSPETYHNNIFTEASAIYSVAMMAYFVMNDMRPPFWVDEEHRQEALAQRLNGKEIPDPVFVDRFKSLWDLIHVCLCIPNKRPKNFEEFLQALVIAKGVTCPNCGAVLKFKLPSNEDDSQIKISCHKCNTPITIRIQIRSSANNGIPNQDLRHNEFDYQNSRGVHDTDSFASTAAIPGNTRRSPYDGCATTSIPHSTSRSGLHKQGLTCCPPPAAPQCCPPSAAPECEQSIPRETYGVTESATDSKLIKKRSIWSKLFGKKEKTEMVKASAYAPAEIVAHKHFIVRIFIHKQEESNSIDQSVKDVDETAVKKANKPLDIPIKNGDKITIQISMPEGVSVDEPIQSFIWRGHYIECDFGCVLTKKYSFSVLGKAIVAINNVPRGNLKFTLEEVSTEMPKIYAPVEPRRYSKIFISYAHADYSQVKGIAEGCKMNGTDYFFDRHSLQAGDIFKDKIFQYIDNADLFVLCWSKNAAESEWVRIEREHALELIKRGNQQLTIYPLSMLPEAPLPADMSDKYNFGTL